jgi:hypothetical protein
MRCKIFVSCGQRPGEKAVAGEVGKLLHERGFDVYIAIDVQTILEINHGIIGELKNSDCYLFVNFRREQLGDKYRGSLFSNQELAIAYALGFERILVVNQEGILPEGILGYIGINTETFLGFEDCCATVARALERSGWTPDYSMRLRAGRLRLSDESIRYGNLAGRFLYIDIENHRPDIAALEATGRLAEYGPSGQTLQPCGIRSPLKATGRPGFSHTIFPKSHEAFDLLCLGMYRRADELDCSAPPVSGAFLRTSGGLLRTVTLREERGLFLNTALDRAGAQRLPITPGTWRFRYEFFAIDFPLLSVLLEVAFTDWEDLTTRILTQEGA